ncbi:hypothetical protein SRCM100623_02341 [Acetobacter pasteurianus]|uniref:Uncharacterized protein n=1 Tax=Acetobacter pasteurianus TaxID=438 RepID=A0A1A0D1U8_ACEPA|nr:hypothetical protein [Acetobacter pasteurianus]OAZ69035.1 hypothetical protein SRCM100623_02341 [Acetobacter pasteurianus]
MQALALLPAPTSFTIFSPKIERNEFLVETSSLEGRISTLETNLAKLLEDLDLGGKHSFKEDAEEIASTILDAKDSAKAAEQDTRRIKSAIEVHRFILVSLLKHLDASAVSNILKETAAYASSFPADPQNPNTLRAGSRLSGLELRAFNKELEAINALLKH